MLELSDFIKNYIKNLCDINHDGVLSESAVVKDKTYKEVSIFQKAIESYNHTDGTFVIEDKTYCIFDIKLPHADIVEKNDATRVDRTNIDIQIKSTDLEPINEVPISKKVNSDIPKKMYDKWSHLFKDSPLKEDFYEKLYQVIKTLHCSISVHKFDSSKYSSIEEQTMDEIIAIFAGESKLNPKAKNSIYRGIFQLATPGLTDAKKWAAKHPEVPGMDNINQKISIDGFAKLSGCDQLDYLVAYIGKAREYSKLSNDENISPSQLWAIIKEPFKGKADSKTTLSKIAAINQVFISSSIERGA